MRAAKYLGVPPWDLMHRVNEMGEEAWLKWAYVAEAAEVQARNSAERQGQSKRKSKGKRA